MEISRLEFPEGSGRTLVEIRNKYTRPLLKSGDRFLNLSFSPSRYFIKEEELIAVHNCYGDAEINGVSIDNISCPRFFKITNDIEFRIKLPLEKIKLIEENRRNSDIDIRLNLKVLFSNSNERFYRSDDKFENTLSLFASIPKSKWIENYLTIWKYYSNTETILSLGDINRFNDVMKSLEKCRMYFTETMYDEVLQEGFKILEVVPKKLGYKDTKEMFSILKQNDNDYLKLKYDSLDKIYEGLKKFPHLSRHGKINEEGNVVEGHINKDDAQFFLNSMEILLNYVFKDVK